MPSITSDTPRVGDPRAADPVYTALLRRRNLFAVIAVFFLVLTAITAVLDVTTTAREDRSFTVDASPRLVVRNGVGGGLRGGIAVRAAAGDRLRVKGKVHGTWRVRYVLEQRGEDVVIEAQPRPLLGWLSVLGPSRFSITAPPQTRLDIETRNAPIDVHGIAGGGSLQTTNGAIRVEDAKGRIAAATSNGTINVAAFDGAAMLQTTNGTIAVRGSRGTFDVATTNGAILLDAELTSGARHRMETTNGSVTVHLRGAPSLRVDARTTNGAIEASAALVAVQRTSNGLVGTIGTGEGALSVRTTNGKITID